MSTFTASDIIALLAIHVGDKQALVNPDANTQGEWYLWYHGARLRLQRMGLVEDRPERVVGADTTAKGRALVDHILALKVPVETYVMPT